MYYYNNEPSRITHGLMLMSDVSTIVGSTGVVVSKGNSVSGGDFSGGTSCDSITSSIYEEILWVTDGSQLKIILFLS